MGKIPGLNDLRIFESAGRLQNFRRAADELHVTHSAVSHRIRALENQLGFALFERQNGVQLTDAGRELYIVVNQSLAQLSVTIHGLTQQHRVKRNTVRISVLPAFAMYWLLPRLHSFYAEFPHISLQIQADTELAELAEHGVDLAVRFGIGHWPNSNAVQLLPDYYYPVAAPVFVARHAITSIEQLLGLPLLVHSNTKGAGASWSDYFKALNTTPPALLNTISFDHTNLVIEAAEQGYGIAFERHSNVAEKISQGKLQTLLNTFIVSHSCYYLLRNPDTLNDPIISKVHTWLLAQAEDFTKLATEIFANKGLMIATKDPV